MEKETQKKTNENNPWDVRSQLNNNINLLTSHLWAYVNLLRSMESKRSS